MKALLQRVTFAKVIIDKKVYSSIDHGLLILIGIDKTDDESNAKRLAEKILLFRVFSDQDDKMNLNVQEVNGSVLFVPQFTLSALTTKGLRPSFSHAAEPKTSKILFDSVINYAKTKYRDIKKGHFGAHMSIELCNDGPVTFLLE